MQTVSDKQLSQTLDSELADFFFGEWQLVEEARLDAVKRLMAVCRAMNSARQYLSHDLLQVLVEDKWQEGVVTKSLAKASVHILHAVRAIEKPTTLESVITGPPWP